MMRVEMKQAKMKPIKLRQTELNLTYRVECSI
jgi:hypothetical protein